MTLDADAPLISPAFGRRPSSEEQGNAAAAIGQKWGVSLAGGADPSFTTLAHAAAARRASLPAEGQARFFDPLLTALAADPDLDRWRPFLLAGALMWSFAPMAQSLAASGGPLRSARSAKEGAKHWPGKLSPEEGHAWPRLLFGEAPDHPEAAGCAQALTDAGLDVAGRHDVFLAHACASRRMDWALWALENGAPGDSLWKGQNPLWCLFRGFGPNSPWQNPLDPARELCARLLAAGADPLWRVDGVTFLEKTLSDQPAWAEFPAEQTDFLGRLVARAAQIDLAATAQACAPMANAPWLGDARAVARAPVEALALGAALRSRAHSGVESGPRQPARRRASPRI